MSSLKTASRRWWRDPLAHFLMIGGLFFALEVMLMGTEDTRVAEQTTIRVSAEHAAELKSALSLQRGHDPNEQELKASIERFVNDEVMVREARRLGLDRGDLIIRRRLIQKMQFLIDDMAVSAPPTSSELISWFNEHRAQYQGVERYDVTQVYFATERRGDAAERDALDALNAWRAAGAEPSGDPFLGGGLLTRRTLQQLKRRFGEAFAAQVGAASRAQVPETWYGPVRSVFGYHLLRVTSTQPAAAPSLDAVRSRVRADLIEMRRRQMAGQARAKLRERFTVEVEATP